jgi:fumarate reductase iron-sulfur subunit
MSEKITIKIERYNKELDEDIQLVEYQVPSNTTLLKAFEYIKTKIDASFSFSSSCRSEICGSCAVRVNSREELSCKYRPKDGDEISALRNCEILKDLIVDTKENFKKIKLANAYMDKYQDTLITNKDQKSYSLQSECILCNSCYSACPVFSVNDDFLGPFVLTKVYRYVSDKSESNIDSKIDNIQKNGIWDCTMCSECAFVCPQGIQPNMDIMILRNTSTQRGYQNPHMQNMASFGTDFGGFNPNF